MAQHEGRSSAAGRWLTADGSLCLQFHSCQAGQAEPSGSLWFSASPQSASRGRPTRAPPGPLGGMGDGNKPCPAPHMSGCPLTAEVRTQPVRQETWAWAHLATLVMTGQLPHYLVIHLLIYRIRDHPNVPLALGWPQLRLLWEQPSQFGQA